MNRNSSPLSPAPARSSAPLQIGPAEFEEMFACPHGSLPPAALAELAQINTSHQEAGVADLEEYILDYLRQIEMPRLRRSREENLAAFERGWGENYTKLQIDGVSLAALKPGYFRGCRFLRYRGHIITTANLQLEFDLFKVARLILFDRYLRGAGTIWELGCGSCQNILMLAQLLPDAVLYAADWTTASQKIAAHLSRELRRPITGVRLDMGDLTQAPAITPGCAIVTIHAFEQLGSDFSGILQLMLAARPSVVVQYEPVLEFYDPNNLYDALALRYCRQRNYLEGYYPALKRLQDEGRIEILAARRPQLGGTLHEASLLVWRPRPPVL